MLNHEESQRLNDELHVDAQRSEILAIIKHDGPCTVAHISRASGIDPWAVREHCEAMVADEAISFKLWRYQA